MSGAFPSTDCIRHSWNDDRFFYAIVQGPTTLDVPKEAMNLGNFQIIACVAGVLLVLGMQKMRGMQSENEKKRHTRNRRRRAMKA